MVLCLLLAVALAVLIILPTRSKLPEPDDHTAFKEAIALYGEQMTGEERQRKADYAASHFSRPSYPDSNTRQARTYRSSYNKEKRLVVELNSADTTELQKLYGIGPVFAARIVKYRNLLGGFTRKEQLLEVYGMSSERYEGMVHSVTIDTTQVVKIDINHATLQQLKRHPYLDYYQAKAICEYRQKAGTIDNYSDLLKINLIDEETATKLQGYIQFNN